MTCANLFVKYHTLENLIWELVNVDHETPPKSLSANAFSAGQQSAACIAASPVVNPAINLNGQWEYGGVPGPVISVIGNQIVVDMSAYKRNGKSRPAAIGLITDSSDILVSFPDDAIYSGKLHAPHSITWSNNSTWT